MASKARKRLQLITLSGINFYITSVYSVIISALVVRLHSADVWGAMAVILLWIGVTANIGYWGNKDFMMREFSMHPSSEALAWDRFFSTRIWLLIPSVSILFFLSVEGASFSSLITFLVARFIYQSYDPVIVFRRKFALSILAETLAFILISALLIYIRVISIQILVLIFLLGEILKAGLTAVYFQREFSPFKISKPHFDDLIKAGSFFLLGFTGLLASRADLMCVSEFLSQGDIAHYQVLVNFLLLSSGISVVILQPFIKNIYRLQQTQINRIARQLFFFGVFITPIIMILINWVIRLVYQFQISIFQLLLGALFIIPYFGFAAMIYNLFRHNRQNAVIIVSLFIAAFSYGLTFALMKTVSVSLNNGLIAIACSAWLMFLVYFVLNSRYRNEAQSAQ